MRHQFFDQFDTLEKQSPEIRPAAAADLTKLYGLDHIAQSDNQSNRHMQHVLEKLGYRYPLHPKKMLSGLLTEKPSMNQNARDVIQV